MWLGQDKSFSYFAFHTSIVNNLVNVIGRHTRLRRSCGDIQNLTRQSAHFAHARLLLLIENSDLVPVHKHLF